MLHGIETLISRAYAKLGKTLSGELRKARESARNEAHLATLGDRPFVGCQPRMAERPENERPARHNPPAAPRDESSV